MANELVYSVKLKTSGLSDKGVKNLEQSFEQLKAAVESTGAVMTETDYGLKQLRKYEKQIENIIKKRDALQAELANAAPAFTTDMGNLPKQTEQTARQFDQLGFSIQQVARELPAFAFSASTGFMAISNNLPMLADAIQQLRRENEALAASGQKTVPVWRQVAQSLLSWNTALSVGITLLTVYAPKITEAVSKMNLFKKALDPAAEAGKQLNEAVKKGTEEAQKEIVQLKVLYSAATDDTRSRKERLDAVKQLQTEYPAYFENLSNESILAGDAADAYNRLTKSLTDAAMARASMDKMTQNATRLLDLNDQRDKLETQLKDMQRLRDSMGSNPALMSSYGQMDSRARSVESQLKSVINEIDALNAANEKLSKGINVSSLTGGGKGSTSKDLNTNLATIGGLTNKINELKEAQSKASTEQAVNLEKEIQLYQQRLNLLQLTIAKGAAGNLADSNYKDKLAAPAMSGVAAPSEIAIPITFEMSENQLQENLQRMRQMFSDSIPEFNYTESALSGLNSIATVVGNLSGVLNDSAGAWAQWGATVMQTIAQAIPQIIALANTQIAASVQQTTANTAVAASGAAASVASIPIVGWVMAAGAVASILAALASLPKPKALAKGGIVSGPTLALVGEYGGARNNPEVIAPLDKLRSLIQPAGFNTDGLYLETKVRGKDLYVALQSVEHGRRRTR